MAEDKIFADGFIFKLPHQNAPDFVKGGISIKAEEAIAFINQHKDESGWLNLSLKESKGGKGYAELDTWKPTQGASAAQGLSEARETMAATAPADAGFEDSDLPF
jgi:hypothetical protein